MSLYHQTRITLATAVLVAVAGLAAPVAAQDAPTISPLPLNVKGSVPPLMMMVMSRDEQLFMKAYADYTDLDGDGLLDTTYQDAFDYSGYFDSGRCYTYSSNRFKAASLATDRNSNGKAHECNNQWSGNFLNWVAMSRLDVLRHVLYGGLRSTDGSTTVLERAHIPNDLHAWVKVYSGSDINSFTPYSSTRSFCNTSLSNAANADPKMRVATGPWTEWSSTALHQCLMDSETGSSDTRNDSPSSLADEFNVRVEVCDPGSTVRESFCKSYGSSSKPVGLLQEYGEDGRMRFGLLTGSFSRPRSGGVLRRNIGKLADNDSNPATTTCSAGDEIDLGNGRFCNQGSGDAGIINTMSRLKLTTWNGWTSDDKWTDCNNWGILNRQGQQGGNGVLNNPGTGSSNCNAWGNPLSEMYAEALRYIAGEDTASAAFTGGSDLSGLPTNVSWLDPYRSPDSGGNPYCADCSILLLSTGLNSFDSDEIPAVPGLQGATMATNTVGDSDHEGIAGNYLVGRVAPGGLPLGASLNTHEDLCTSKTVANLGEVRGICPDIPSMEGSYLMSGLAFQAKTVDLRPDLDSRPADHKNTVQTFAVALAENLPKFEIPVGSGSITLAPLCQANGDGGAGIGTTTGWRSCFLGAVGVGTKTSSVSPNHVYGRPLRSDGRAGSFSLVWEDSLWGNDHDNDVVSMMTYCVGATCTRDTIGSYGGYDICWRSDSSVCGGSGQPSVGAGEMLVRIENLSAYAGNAMLSGFAVTGSSNDGTHRLALRPGNQNGSVLTTTEDPPATWGKPKVLKLSSGGSGAGQLQNPLFYAAKYGGFVDSNGNGKPDSGEWDGKVSGTPDNYFLVRDPARLKKQLQEVFDRASRSKGVANHSQTGARVGDNSFTVETTYEVGEEGDWFGRMDAFAVNENGAKVEPGRWSTDTTLTPDDEAGRDIYTMKVVGGAPPTLTAVEFKAVNLGDNENARLQALGLDGDDIDASADEIVTYLRGDDQGEGGDVFRNRSQVLGDIVNSRVEISSPRDDYSWAYLTDSDGTDFDPFGYKDHLETKAARLGENGQGSYVYVGANDGMLHAFNGATGDEEFAFIPSEVLGRMGALADPGYEHRYYVDGEIAISDVLFGSSDWHTVLVGTTAAGGRSVFALDVSNPAAFNEDDVLWELNDRVDGDIGYTFGRPAVVPVSGDHWVALFGNGYNGARGLPILYAVDFSDGEVHKIEVPEEFAGGGNGLGHLAVVDLYDDEGRSISDGRVDTVYGADLRGNVWKFDLRDSDPDDWEVAYEEPLFTAKDADGNAQPITGGLEAARGPSGGVMLFFGTGRYFAVGDNLVSADPPVHSLYGIWDDFQTPLTTGRSRLSEQRIVVQPVGDPPPQREVTENAVNYAPSGQRGWYLDLVVGTGAGKGERFIGFPRVQNGIAFFTTYEPAFEPEDECQPIGYNWLYGLNLLTGAAALNQVKVPDESGGPPRSACPDGGCGGIGLVGGAPIRDTSIWIPKNPPIPGLTCDPADPDCVAPGGFPQCTLIIRAPGAPDLILPRPCGRQSWRQVK